MKLTEQEEFMLKQYLIEDKEDKAFRLKLKRLMKKDSVKLDEKSFVHLIRLIDDRVFDVGQTKYKEGYKDGYKAREEDEILNGGSPVHKMEDKEYAPKEIVNWFTKDTKENKIEITLSGEQTERLKTGTTKLSKKQLEEFKNNGTVKLSEEQIEELTGRRA